MSMNSSRREFLRNLGIGAAAAPFVLNLPSLGFANAGAARKQRLVVMFSPNGGIPSTFWQDQEALKSILDEVREDLDGLRPRLSAEDRRLLEEHAAFVRDMEQQLAAAKAPKDAPKPPSLDVGVKDDNESIPRLSKMQIDLLVNGFVNDFARISTIQY